MIKTKKCWQIKNEAESVAAEILIYGEISDESWFGDEVTPKQFADDLRQLGGKDITLRINSPGGDVFAAQSIYNQLSTYTGNVIVRIDGMCASAATIISCAGNIVIMPDNAIFMIHNPKSALIGYYDSADMQAISNQLDTVKQTIINVYNKRSTLSENKIKKMMDAESWMTAQEAKNNGFIDEIDTTNKVENSIKDGVFIVNSVSCDLKRFKNSKKLEEILNKSKGKGALNMSEHESKDANIIEVIKNLLGMGNQESTKNTKPEANTAPPTNSAVEDAVKAERQRIAYLDAMYNGDLTVKNIIDTAKKTGATAESVRAYVDAVKTTEQSNANNKVVDTIKNIIQDNMDSGAKDVLPGANGRITDKEKDAVKKKQQVDEIVNIINNSRGLK